MHKGSNEKECPVEIIINDAVLTEEQLVGLEAIYRFRPNPGNYWYDVVSGLYGINGYPSAGFMLAGHDLGEIRRDASMGNTGILVNGRELPQIEWILWSRMVGNPIMPGAYWLDHHGNAGYVGNPYPVINLVMAARQQMMGGGAGGDNIWSTRFSAGNFSEGNQQGYVSVPGHGPIGYGF
ncbi:MAG: hypothetical protein R2747_22735 [Pyrinomonadaceae bacterium]